MHFDRLDETYAMVKFILSFEQHDNTVLTGFGGRSDWSCTAVPILVVNTRRPEAGARGGGGGRPVGLWPADRPIGY